MNKLTIIASALYIIAVIFFVMNLIKNESIFMFLGGISLLAGSIVTLIHDRKKKK